MFKTSMVTGWCLSWLCATSSNLGQSSRGRSQRESVASSVCCSPCVVKYQPHLATSGAWKPCFFFFAFLVFSWPWEYCVLPEVFSYIMNIFSCSCFSGVLDLERMHEKTISAAFKRCPLHHVSVVCSRVPLSPLLKVFHDSKWGLWSLVLR